MNKNFLFGFLMGTLIIACMAIIPFAFIWSLNSLFPVLAIPETIQTYLAAWSLLSILHFTCSTSVKVSK